MTKTMTLTNSDELILVSDEDYDYLIQWNWRLNIIYNGGKSITRSQKINNIQTTIYISREIAERMNLDLTNEIDHKDRDIFNNQRSNLRAATRSQNMANTGLRKDNTTGYKGVSFHIQHQKYKHKISIKGKRKHLGLFINLEDAARAYDKAAKQYHGIFAVLNFPEE